jgi:hypothetical protein
MYLPAGAVDRGISLARTAAMERRYTKMLRNALYHRHHGIIRATRVAFPSAFLVFFALDVVAAARHANHDSFLHALKHFFYCQVCSFYEPA